MVAVGSFVVLLITIFGLGFDGTKYSTYLSKDVFGYRYFFRQGNNLQITNWLGIFALFNIAISSVGFFLFKDK